MGKLIWMLLSFILMVLLIAILLSDPYKPKDVDKRLIELNKAQYNIQSGDFEITDPEIKYILTGKK